jgi:hypothetical protein
LHPLPKAMGPARWRHTFAEGSQYALLVAHDDNGLARNVGGKETFWIGYGAFYAVNFAARVAESTDQLPSAQKNARLFNVEDGGIGIKPGREGVSALDLLVYVELQRLGVHDRGRIRIFWFPASTSAL